LAVIGDSGSGKSSLVKAGVIPKLLDVSTNVNFHVIETRPARNPFVELTRSISEICETRNYNEMEIGYFIDKVKTEEPKAIHAVLERLFKEDGSELLLYIDQFEELFTLCDEVLQKKFTELLLFLLENQTQYLGIKIIFTMRRDYYNLLREQDAFYKTIAERTYTVKRMNDESLREVIEKPLELLSVNQSEIEQLSNVILWDLGDEAKEITLLQIALTETWFNKAKYGHKLLASYVGIGRVTGALSFLATNALESLDEKEQALFKYIFIRIVKFNDIGGMTRRLADREEFSDEAWALVQKLASAYASEKNQNNKLGRLLKVKSSFKDNEEVIELIHEALTTQWATYVTWIRTVNKENRKRIHNVLIAKSKAYKKNPERKFLLSGYALEEGQKLLDEEYRPYLSKFEKEFIEKSQKSENRAIFWKRFGVGTLVVLVVLSAYFAYRVNIVSKDIKSMVNAFYTTNSKICGSHAIEVYEEVIIKLLKNNQMEYLAYIYSELGDKYSFKQEYLKAKNNYVKALNSYRSYIILNPNYYLNYNNVFELELILGEKLHSAYKEVYIQKFKADSKAMKYYHMLDILQKIIDNEKIDLYEWQENFQYINVSWNFSTLYIWAYQIEDKQKQNKIFGALKVFDKGYYRHKVYYKTKNGFSK